MNNREHLKKIILANALFYDSDMNPARLEMFVQELEDLPVEQVNAAFLSARRQSNRTRLPMPGEIRLMIRPEVTDRDQGQLVAEKIVSAIKKHGGWGGDDARAELGDFAWRIVEGWGGWSYLCENHGNNIDAGQFNAQTRDRVESMMRAAKAGTLDDKIALPPSNQERLGELVVFIDKLSEQKKLT